MNISDKTADLCKKLVQVEIERSKIMHKPKSRELVSALKELNCEYDFVKSVTAMLKEQRNIDERFMKVLRG